jgi:hypothetical protein
MGELLLRVEFGTSTRIAAVHPFIVHLCVLSTRQFETVPIFGIFRFRKSFVFNQVCRRADNRIRICSRNKKARFLAGKRASEKEERGRIPDNIGVPPNHQTRV